MLLFTEPQPCRTSIIHKVLWEIPSKSDVLRNQQIMCCEDYCFYLACTIIFINDLRKKFCFSTEC